MAAGVAVAEGVCVASAGACAPLQAAIDRSMLLPAGSCLQNKSRFLFSSVILLAMLVVIRSGRSRRLFFLYPCTKPLPERFFRYRLQQKVVHAQPERMQGKIQLAAPDDARFREKRPQVLHRIQHPRPEGKLRRWSAHFCARPQRIPPARGSSPPWETDRALRRTVKAVLCKRSPAFRSLSARQCGTRHSLLLPSLMLSACQYTDMQTLFKPFGTKPSIPSRNLSFSLCRCWTGMI